MPADGAQRTYWDEYYRGLRERGSDLDWSGRWTDPFLPLLRAGGARNVWRVAARPVTRASVK